GPARAPRGGAGQHRSASGRHLAGPGRSRGQRVLPPAQDGAGDQCPARAVSLVTYELDDHVATITYNRPEALNAINGEMRRDLNGAFARFRDEDVARYAIVTGEGRAFCAGGDMRGEAGATGEFAGTFWEKPTINSFESGW